MRRYDRRIALYASSSANRGGTGVYTRRLINGFREAGITSVIPFSSDCSNVAEKLISEHFTIPRLVKRGGFDLLHLPAFGGKPPKGISYAVTVHDMAFMARRDWFPPLRSLYYRLHFPRVAGGAAVIIADSDFTVSEIRKYLDLPAYRVYLSAPENNSDDTLFRRTYGVDGKYILSTSTIEPRKNTGSLLKAWPLIKREHPDMTLVVAGRWGWGQKETKHALVNTPGVKWVGSIPDDQLMSAFAGTLLLVYPSLYEGFGLPPLESAASGVPFVIGPSEALYEVFGSVAAAITGETPDSIAGAVLNALKTPFDPGDLRKFAREFKDTTMAENTYAAYGRAFS
ncbi:MAG: glycosyltransferase family 4 protein [Candidatus Sabulitectum sp.]|nr:glycosyltransferase family 4 protein [Candidatus Sabulitectum sp.]